MTLRHLLLGAVFALFAVTGCDGCDDDPGEGGADAGMEEYDLGRLPDGGIASIDEPRITAEALFPIVTPVGASGELPTRLDITFAVPVIDDGPRPVGGDTVVQIEPRVQGTLAFSNNNTLSFQPREGFNHGTEYKVSLVSVESTDGALQRAEPWTATFKTPDFGFVSMSAPTSDLKSQMVEVELYFTGPVRPDDVGSYGSWEVGGRSLAGSATYAQGSSPNSVRAYLRQRVEDGTEIAFNLSAGMPSLSGDASAGEATASQNLSRGEAAEIYDIRREEGPTGFHVSIACRDRAAPGGTRYYWSPRLRDSFRVSRRCLPTDESAAKYIEINPKVKFTVAPGRYGFNIMGDFRRSSYTVRVLPGLQTIDGGLVRTGAEENVSIPARSPELEFVNKGRYLPRSEWSKLAMKHMNVRELEVEIRHVPRKNLTFWMSGEDETFSNRVSNVVARDRVVLKGEEDTLNTTRLNVTDLVKDPKPGVYEVRTRGLGEQDAVRLLLTDMNLIVKRSEQRPGAPWSEEAYAWVVDMKTAKPLEGVEVKAIRPSGDVVGSCKTGAQGGCRVSMPVDALDPSAPFAFIATRDDDFTYLKYSELFTAAPGDTSGEPYLAEAAYRAAIYSDRDLYRPAETAHIVAILRKDGEYKSPGNNVPVELTMRDPRGNIVLSKVLRTNEAGVISHDEKFGDFATTGGYSVSLKVGKREVGKYKFNVEEFVPERMDVDAEATRPGWLLSEVSQFKINAQYLFGGSAENSSVEVTCRLEPAKFEPKGKDDYTFGPAVTLAGSSLDLGQVEGTLDANGETLAECPKPPQEDGLAGPSRIVATAAVFEAGSGRSTTDVARAMAHPENYYVGLKTGAEKVFSGKQFKTEGIVVDWEGKVTRDVKKVRVDLIRLDYEYYWYDNDEAQSSWGQNLRPVLESTTELPVRDGKFTVDATPARDGQAYVVRVYHGRSVTDLKLEGDGRRYWWNESSDSADRTPRPTRPTQVAIVAPDEVEVGKKAKFKFEVPFSGRMLVTVETNRVITHEWHDVKAGEFEWTFMLGKFDPTVYVTGFLIKDPHLDSKEAFLPDRAFGVVKVRVKPTEMMHTLKVEAPKEVRPNSELEVLVDLGGPVDKPTFVTVAAVDEGILSLTDMETPDPTKQIFAERALGVSTFETIGWALQSDPSGVSSKTGGGDDWEDEYDADGGGLDRAMPVRPVALWSGLVRVDANGKARVKFDIPTYRGALRVMAVTADDSKTGSIDTRVTVRDPLVLQTTLPRFMSGGDKIQVPVFVTNMTGAAGTAEVELSASEEAIPGLSGFSSDQPIVTVRGKSKRTIQLGEGKSGTVVFEVTANKQAGVAKFRVDAKMGKVTSFDEGIVPFRPNGPHERRVETITLTSGVNDLSGALDGWVPTSERSTIWVTASPHGKAFDHLKYLIRYPYGCIEQTTSSTRPLLYVSDIVQLSDPTSVARGGGIEKMVEYGINRALSMQTPSGGFGYWPGNNDPWPWATAYATHMLIDAKRQGFDVPQQRIDSALSYMEKEIGNSRGDRYGYRDANGYMSYVLALAGRGNKAQIQALIDRIGPGKVKGREQERQYMLKAALYMAGDRRYADDLKAIDFSQIQGERESRWSYYSERRHRAFIFNIYQDAFENDAKADELANKIGKDLAEQSSYRYTTQELMWGITGLGKWTVKQAASFKPPKLELNGKSIKPTVTPKKASDRSWAVARASEYDSVKVDLPKTEKTVYAIVSSEGVRTNSEPKIGGNGLTIAREFYNYEGQKIEPDGHTLGDLLFVEISVKNTSGKTLNNLALVDRFAGGFEVENPRLGRGTLPDWVDEDKIWAVDHMNVRDDRIEAFGTLSSGESRTFVYAVRAVSAGEFFAPPPELEGMYEPEMWARSQPARVTVQGPWESLID